MSPRRLLLLLLLPLISGLLAAAPAAASTAAGPVYAQDPLTHKLKIKPHRLTFSDSKFTELRWRHWGTDVARARGIHRMLTWAEPARKARRAASAPRSCPAARAGHARPRRHGGRGYCCPCDKPGPQRRADLGDGAARDRRLREPAEEPVDGAVVAPQRDRHAGGLERAGVRLPLVAQHVLADA